MHYSEMFVILKSIFDLSADHTDLPGTMGSIINRQFHSHGQDLLPGASQYACKIHGIKFPAETDPESLWMPLIGLSVPDAAFETNSSFRYPLFKPVGINKAKGCIILLHGLNERSWDKYLPWAVRLAEWTAQAVIIMPIAFHMNRAPVDWGIPRQMKTISEHRQKYFPSIAESSFANAAISTRLHHFPHRFFWSGIQTYQDILQLVQGIRGGHDPDIAEDAPINLFGYSIGGFLSEILCMANEDDLFSASKLVIFCGGPTFDRMYPASKYILDSEALVALYSFFIGHLENKCRDNPRLAHYFSYGHPSGIYFKTMLAHGKLKDVREKRFRELADQIIAIALQRDDVVRPWEVIHTLQGDDRKTPIRVHSLDFPYPYSHINPFPIRRNIEAEVDAHFDQIFELAAAHFLSK
jgi:hypothetical protein